MSEPITTKAPWHDDPIQQIVIERVQTKEGVLGWAWDAFGENTRLAGGVMLTLSQCADGLRQFLRDEGIAP